jgi:hypothetical protein
MRASQTITEQEILAYVKFCRDNNIVNYDGEDAETLANAQVVAEYFLETWNQEMSEANFVLALPQLKSRLKFYSSPQQAEFTHIANENINAAQQLISWLNAQRQLVNTPGDAETYENLALLLTELRNRREDVSATTVRNAIDRIGHRPGRQLHFVQAPRRTEPVSPAAKADDGVQFLGKNLNEPEWVRRSRERSEREAREAASQQSAASAQTAAIREAQRKSQELRGNTHAEDEQIARVFVTTSTNEIDWPGTYAARLALQKNFQKAQEVRRFVR